MTLDFDKFTIKTIDRYNLGLFEKRIIGGTGRGRKNSKNAGEQKEVLLGYYGDLNSALYSCSKHFILSDEEIYNVNSIIDKLDEINKTIKEVSKNVMD